MKKRKICVLCAAFLLSTGIWIYRLTVLETAFLTVRRCTLEVPKLPAEHENLTVALLGDLHCRSVMFRNGFLKRITARLEELRPDLVLVAGDMLERCSPLTPEELDILAQTVTEWHGKYGTVVIAGNHEMWLSCRQNWKYLSERLRQKGVRVLEDENCRLPVRGKIFQIAGCSDHLEVWYQMKRIGAELDVSLPRYGIIHNPEFLYFRDNPFDVMFSAHTHAGQVRFPVFGSGFQALIFNGWFGSGIRRYRNCVQFTTSGLGTSTLFARWYNMPEIALLTLRRAED